MDEYAELVLEIFPQAGETFRVRLRYSEPQTAGEAAPVSGVAVFDEAALRELRRTALDPAVHGRLLRKFWLEDAGLLAAWSDFLQRSGGRSRLRLQIDPGAAWLHALRWETLRDAEDRDFVALNANRPFSRFLYSAEADGLELRPRRDLRALLLAANPAELERPGGYTLLAGPAAESGAGVTLAPVDVAGELGRARQALGELDIDLLAAPLPDGSLLPGTLGRPTFERLADCLRRGYDVVYLVAHGGILPGSQTGVEFGVRSLELIPGEPLGPAPGVENLGHSGGGGNTASAIEKGGPSTGVRRSPPGVEAFVLLEKEDGTAQRVSAEALAACIRNLAGEARPRLAALASCQSGGRGRVPSAARDPGEADEDERSYDRGALAALGPLLVDAGIPAVVAMQANVKMETARRFMQVFFDELFETGRVDQAAAAARSQARDRADWWAPVLYLRLRSGLLFPTADGRPIRRLPFEPQTVHIPAGMLEFPDEGLQAFVPAFRIGRYPVTNREYQRFLHTTRRMPPPELGWGGQEPPAGQEAHPVRGVTWFEALEYCAWLTEQTGRAYGLPSDGQWQMAAFGPCRRSFPWGDAWQAGRCNAGAPRAAAVNAFPPQNEAGLCDLVGNTLQWTTTLWGEQRLAPDARYAPPWRPDDGRDDPNANRQVRRVARGSTYKDPPERCSASLPRSFLPTERGQLDKRLGFRIVINDL